MIAPTEPLAAFARMVESYHYYCEAKSHNFDPADWTYWYVPGEGWSAWPTVLGENSDLRVDGAESQAQLEAWIRDLWDDAHVHAYPVVCEVVVARGTYDPSYGDRGSMADAIDHLALGVIASWYGVDATVAIMAWLWHDVHNMHDGLDVEQAENDIELGLVALGRESR